MLDRSNLGRSVDRRNIFEGPITLWIDEILPPHLCSVCFITFKDSSKANLVLEKFDKNLGFGQTPPCLVQKTKFFRFSFSEGSPYADTGDLSIVVKGQRKLRQYLPEGYSWSVQIALGLCISTRRTFSTRTWRHFCHFQEVGQNWRLWDLEDPVSHPGPGKSGGRHPSLLYLIILLSKCPEYGKIF